MLYRKIMYEWILTRTDAVKNNIKLFEPTWLLEKVSHCVKTKIIETLVDRRTKFTWSVPSEVVFTDWAIF